MIQTYHHGRFEFFVASAVIAIIAFAALSRYSLMADDAKILRMELISHQFMTGAANIRVKFLVANTGAERSNKTPFDIAGKRFYFSEQGWPLSVKAVVDDNYRPTDDDCHQLWQLLLQNPAPIAKGKAASHREYRVFAQAGYCRYQMTKGGAYFDYVPLDGSLSFIPDAK